ncbi:MAG: hypothetical protein OXP36_11305 [Gammaproteobacteria bacterium]|nr:hypothetical protein [Gammaproteobacteria bacterium]
MSVSDQLNWSKYASTDWGDLRSPQYERISASWESLNPIAATLGRFLAALNRFMDIGQVLLSAG